MGDARNLDYSSSRDYMIIQGYSKRQWKLPCRVEGLGLSPQHLSFDRFRYVWQLQKLKRKVKRRKERHSC